MRVAMLSIHTSPLASLGGKEAGGMNVYVHALSAHLAQRGLRVDIFTRRSAPNLPSVQVLRPGVRLVQLDAGPATPLDKNRVLDYLPQLVDSIAQVAARSGPYDIIHSHYWVSGALALPLRARWGVPVVQMFHTLGALKNQVARGVEETETQARIRLEGHLLHAVDAVVAATPLDRAHMLHYYDAPAARLHVIAPGVDTVHFQPRPQTAARLRLGVPHSTRLLLGVGRMEPLKGFDSLIGALPHLRTQLPDTQAVRLLLLGGAPDSEPAAWNSEQHRLDRLRHRLGVADAVQFGGAQPHAALPDYYAAADVLVMPSHYESFGLVALEAMACGTPVVVSHSGGLGLTVEHERSGLHVPPASAPALAEQIARLLCDDALRARLQAGGRARARAYSWPQVAQRITALYAALRQPG